jgi:hypothetical protein
MLYSRVEVQNINFGILGKSLSLGTENKTKVHDSY